MATTPGMTAGGHKVASSAGMTREERKVIFASSLGTVFEWYDFYLYGSLAAIIGKQFFKGDPTTSFIFALLTFAAGFIVRPFGALVFGRLGDMIGRKYTFLVTILIMGASTFIVGLLPGYDSIGIAAPIILVSLRVLQGLALGGEYGGAATYVAEHAPEGKRGAFTSWIQTTATMGLFLSLLVILGTRSRPWAKRRSQPGAGASPSWSPCCCWAVSVWIRLSMNESPAFTKMKAEGKTSKAPLTESFLQPRNAKIVLLALIGLTMGQAVVWYTGQFYALFFLTQTLKVDGPTANIMIAIALALATPFFIFFGTLSDKIGRKWIILGGCLIAALTYFPIFGQITHYANPALETALKNSPVVVVADPATCNFQFNPTGTKKFPFVLRHRHRHADRRFGRLHPPGCPSGHHRYRQGRRQGHPVVQRHPRRRRPEFRCRQQKVGSSLENRYRRRRQRAGYPAKADPAQINKPMTVLFLFILVIYVTMVYGPVAAMLVEMFPTRIRYTSMSLPYHIGNGWFGGLLPTISFAMVAFKGDIYYGLWYPIIIALITVVIGGLFVRETKDNDIYAAD